MVVSKKSKDITAENKTKKNTIQNNATKVENAVKMDNVEKVDEVKKKVFKMPKLPKLDSLKMLHDVIKKQLPLISKMDVSAETDKIENSEIYLHKKKQFFVVNNIVSGALKNAQYITKRIVSNDVPEYIPLESNNLHSCIKAEYNIDNNVETIDKWQNLYKSNGKKYAYMVKVFKPDDHYDIDINFLSKIEAEAKITKKMGELGLGPKLYDVYYCNDNNEHKYYFVMEYMNEGLLSSYLDKNNLKKIPAIHIKQLLDKLKKLHKYGYIHGSLYSWSSIFVHKKLNKKLDFFFGDFGNAINVDEKEQKDKTAEFDRFKSTLENSWYRENEQIAEYLSKYILVNYDIDI